ncbi:response regulator [Bogoriella caseilytica]|uniref:Transcriptional regulatory protein n=1 Tax=Bogoriella caseilytica TaxID=56055 RepID=A0A3N2B9N5_9MICO|nr:response regulator [Bogoriella caseilytica]ROR71975.1 response regulator of citrate/malate metabolism [Bogoriella caseilytica]
MIRVLVVDDQQIVADGHRALVDRVPGFVTVAVAHSGQAALDRVAQGGVDLILLDFAMPGLHGLEVCRRLQELDLAVDVMAITADRSLESLRQSVRLGIVSYLIKPFSFASLREKLEHYAAFRAATSGDRSVTDQQEIDAAFARLREHSPADMPKGISRETLDDVRAAVAGAPEGITAVQAAAAAGISRVTARRYLEYLIATGGCLREPVRGAHAGRPEIRYRVRPA